MLRKPMKNNFLEQTYHRNIVLKNVIIKINTEINIAITSM